ncbi:NADP-dependent oxidoreductase [Saccharopolyspora sp. K220]|uniref:MDR family NADP-dependent oxidoreductase n=1 Tax=Saccharopolyspora soli TaxID=2926618 RepID=UPI001F588EBE|nr:NADP-dependent oxidoreductase [Saccharopolyspora soli]MCI2417947.1 NADP-dependent oxidoreductase [Saccharopolyspora soli]
MTRTTRIVSLNRYLPTGRVEPEHFTIRTKELPDLTDGEMLLRPIAFSVDATLRGQLTGQDNYFAPQVPLGEAVTGIAVSEVVESRHPDHQPGDRVVGLVEWADLSVWPPRTDWIGLTKLDPRVRKPSHALGVYGLLGGLTAHTGIIEAGQVTAGETVAVSAAAGNVGSLAGQIARIRGARVIGLAGSEQKRKILTEDLGFDAAVDYRAPDLAEQLRALAPDGPDLYFDSVGGRVSQTVMGLMRRPARVVVCGLISTYDDDTAWTVNIKPLFANGLTLQGYTPVQFHDALPAALDHLVDWVETGQLIPLETERHGLEALPGAISGLYRGENIGKMVVTVP